MYNYCKPSKNNASIRKSKIYLPTRIKTFEIDRNTLHA